MPGYKNSNKCCIDAFFWQIRPSEQYLLKVSAILQNYPTFESDCIIFSWEKEYEIRTCVHCGSLLELVSKELNHLAAILHVYAGSLIFKSRGSRKKNIFQKEN